MSGKKFYGLASANNYKFWQDSMKLGVLTVMVMFILPGFRKPGSLEIYG
jgi:hypothetical protein